MTLNVKQNIESFLNFLEGKLRGKDFVANVERQLRMIGMRKDEFYKAVGITASAFSLYRSEKTFPSKETLERTANVLNVPVTSLLESPAGAESKGLPATQEENPASSEADGISEKLSKLSPALRKQFVRFLALAKEDPERAARFLEFAAQELEPRE